MEIITCYTADIRKQLTDKGERPVNDRLMKMTADICLKALKYCTDTFLSEWDCLSGIKGSTNRRRACDLLIHSTKGHPAKYPEFDRDFKNFPSYTRRAVVSDALGKVNSYVSNHRNWEKQDPRERGAEPALGLPDRYSLTFYDQERDLCDIEKGIIGLKLYDGKTWGWHCFKISPSLFRGGKEARTGRQQTRLQGARGRPRDKRCGFLVRHGSGRYCPRKRRHTP